MTNQDGRLTTAELEERVALLSCMASTTRLAILSRIIYREWSVNELADDLCISQSALSQHLRKLREAKIVRNRRDRQNMFYRCEDQRVIDLLTQVGVIR